MLEDTLLRQKFNRGRKDVLPDNDGYANMSADKVMETFNNALAEQDFNNIRKLAPDSFVQMLKTESEEAIKLGAIKEGKSLLEVAGQAFWLEEHSAYIVKLRMIGVKAWNLAIRNDNAAKRFLFDGGI